MAGAGLPDIIIESGVFGLADSSFTGAGVWGHGPLGVGVAGTGSWGVYGSGYVGVVGDVGPGETGVYGFIGPSAPPTPTPAGVEARAQSTSYIALNVVGKAKFSRSGRVSIASGGSSKKITMAGVTTSRYIIATLQTRRTGVYVHAVVPASGSFTIYLNKAVTATTTVGYVVIN